jgi:outer membrane protein assembly factor BamB
VQVKHLWGHNMGDKKAAVLRLGQGVSIADNRVYAAGHKGELVALDLTNGRLLWRAKIKAPLRAQIW